jgi:hypothetical protein
VATQSKGANLDPSTHQGGGQVPNGTYDIIKARAILFTYPGTSAQVPSLLVTFKEGGAEYEQQYKAGDTDHLVPSDDGLRFVHPGGEAAAIYKGGACSMFLGSLAKQNFAFKGDAVNQIEGIRVELENAPAPKGKSSDSPDRTIPLVAKILGKSKGSPAARPTAAATASSTVPPAASSTELSDVALTAVLSVLENAQDHKTAIKNIAVKALKYSNGAKLNDLSKLMSPEWLAEQSEATGAFAIDGDSLVGVS